MANNVLKEELVLTTGQFDKNINNVIRKVEELKNKGKNVGDGFEQSLGKIIQKATGFNGSMGSLVGVVGKFSGALGIALGAGEVFNRMMKESQTVGDSVARVQNQASEAVNYFANCLARADFSGFLSGLQDIIDKAGEVADALDDLQSMQLLFDFSHKQMSAEYQKQLMISRDLTKTEKERQDALEKSRQIASKMSENEKQMGKQYADTANKIISTELAKQRKKVGKVDSNFINQWFSFDKFQARKELAATYDKYTAEADKLVNQANASKRKRQKKDLEDRGGFGGTRAMSYNAEEKKMLERAQQLRKERDSNLSLVIAKATSEINDDTESQLSTALKYIGSATELGLDAARREFEMNRSEARLNGSKKSGGTKTPKQHVAEYKEQAETVQEIEDNITVLNKRLKDTKPNTEEYKLVSSEIKKWKELLDTTPKPTFIENATVIKDINSNITILQERLDKTVRGSEEWLTITKQIKDETKKLSDIQDGSLADLQNQVSEIDDKLSKENLSLKTRLELIDKKAEIQKKIDDISDDSYIKVTPIVGDNRRKRNSVSNAQTNINNIANDYDSGLIDYKSAKSQIDKINTDLKNIGAKPIKVHLETDTEKFLSSLETGADSLLSSFNGIDGVIDDITSLSQAISEGANSWEVFMGVLKTGVGIIQTVSTVLNTLNTLQELFGTTSLVAAEQNAAAGASEIATAAGVTAAKSGEAIASATASGAMVPFPLNLIAIAAGVAAVLAALAAITGAFANGGVVGGSQYAGDALLARVNSGEMILNGSQQKNLFDLLDKGTTSNVGGGNVNFVIRGKDLHGVLSNYDDKMKKVR